MKAALLIGMSLVSSAVMASPRESAISRCAVLLEGLEAKVQTAQIIDIAKNTSRGSQESSKSKKVFFNKEGMYLNLKHETDSFGHHYLKSEATNVKGETTQSYVEIKSPLVIREDLDQEIYPVILQNRTFALIPHKVDNKSEMNMSMLEVTDRNQRRITFGRQLDMNPNISVRGLWVAETGKASFNLFYSVNQQLNHFDFTTRLYARSGLLNFSGMPAIAETESTLGAVFSTESNITRILMADAKLGRFVYLTNNNMALVHDVVNIRSRGANTKQIKAIDIDLEGKTVDTFKILKGKIVGDIKGYVQAHDKRSGKVSHFVFDINDNYSVDGKAKAHLLFDEREVKNLLDANLVIEETTPAENN